MTLPASKLPFFPKFLVLVFALFIGILIFIYAASRSATVVILDEHGHPRETSGQTAKRP